MKVKASWVAFVPVAVGAVLLHIYHIFFLGGDEITQALFSNYSLLINKNTEPELIVILAAVLFVLSFFFSIIDRKTSPSCEIKGAPLSGIFLVISGLLLGVDSSVNMMSVMNSGSLTGAILALNLLGFLSALLFAIVGMGLLVSLNIAKKIRIFMLLPTIWASVGMINVFISHRKEAPSFSFFDVFAWVFLTLFLFHNSMVLCGIEIKNPVKSSFVYGLTFVYFAVVYVISSISSSVQELGYFDVIALVQPLLIAALALYALFSLFKLSSKMITKKKAAELSEPTEEDYNSNNKNKDKEEEETPEAAFGVGSTKYVTAEFEKIRLEKAAKKAKERTGTIPTVVAEDEDEEEEEEPMSTLDRIDQLIMELSDENSDK